MNEFDHPNTKRQIKKTKNKSLVVLSYADIIGFNCPSFEMFVFEFVV